MLKKSEWEEALSRHPKNIGSGGRERTLHPDTLFPRVADAQPLPLGEGIPGALQAETDPGEREGSWEAEHLRGHMGSSLGPKHWPGRAQVFWSQG